MPKSAEQLLFERIVRTWLVPEAEKRGALIPLMGALIVLPRDEQPRVYLNQELNGRVLVMDVIAAERVEKGETVTTGKIAGLRRIRLHRDLWGKSYVFVCQGAESKYFVCFAGRHLPNASEFRRLEKALRTAGLELTDSNVAIPIAIDLVGNLYRSMGRKKGTVFKREKAAIVDHAKREADQRVRRMLTLPTYMIHPDDKVLPLLLETRSTYVDGHFFSAIAASATAADCVCLWLIARYRIDKATTKELEEDTLGRKIERLRSLNLINSDQTTILRKLNNIRKRHLHPTRVITSRGMKRDAFAAVRLFHELLESTLSLTRDYEIRDGVFHPKPL